MKLNLLAVFAAVAMLAGACTSSSLIDSVSGMKAQEPGFKAFLHKQYLDLARTELREADFSDSDVFARRAEAAAMGKDVDPDILWDRDFTPNNLDTILKARVRLLDALGGGGREKFPELAATAQTQFDCWAQELEENNQPEDIRKCREGFEAAIGALEEGLKPKPVAKAPEPPAPAPAPKPAPQIARDYLLFFDFDSAKLSEDARAIVLAAVDASRKASVSTIEAIGHADRAGPDKYNLGLSKRRAEAVRAELIRLGVATDDIKIAWKGEREPLVQTADGVREPQNRRVEIILK